MCLLFIFHTKLSKSNSCNNIKKYLLKIFQPFNVQILRFDFDEGAHEAIKKIFSNYIVENRRFYPPLSLMVKRNKYKYKYV